MREGALRRVYCSGPLFCPAEIRAMTEIAGVLEEAGYETFLPHRDGLEAYVMRWTNDPRVGGAMFRSVNRIVRKAVFALDVYQILERCDALVFNMNGRVPDEGAVVETAIAFAAGKPVVLYKRDDRTKLAGNDNPMLTGLSCTFSTVDDVQRIPGEVERVARKLGAMGKSPYGGENTPPFVREVTGFGEEVWRFLEGTRLLGDRRRGIRERLAKLAELCKRAPALGSSARR